MNMKKFFSKKKIILLILIFVILIMGVIILVNNKNDGMEQSGILTVKYRTYSDKNGWSKWTKNGITSGNLNDNISNIGLKLRTKDGTISYKTYSMDDGWSDSKEIDKKYNDKNIYGVSFELIEGIYKKYNICYRTHNKENKWLEWSCNGDMNGNSKQNVNGIQIKIIPKKTILREYLKGYEKNDTISSIGF